MGKHRRERDRIRWGRVFGVFTIASLLVAGSVLLIGGGPGRDERPAMVEPMPGHTPAEVPPTPAPTQAAQTPSPSPLPTPEPPDKVTMHIRAVGDLMAHSANLDAAKADGCYDFTPFFEEIAPSLQVADLTIGNLEVTVSDEVEGIDDGYYTGYPAFRAPGSYLDALSAAGFDVLTLANNHILDKGLSGVVQTIAALDARGIPYCGAYADEESASEILLREHDGIRVAILAYAEYTNANVSAGYAVNYLDEQAIRSDVAVAKEQGADIVLAAVHWGNEYETQESPHQRNWANKFCDAGVDIVIGSHPHVVQPAGWIERETDAGGVHRTFVAYSLGNFISNQQEYPRDAGVIMDFAIEKDLRTGVCEVLEVSFIPTWVLKGPGQGDCYRYAVLPAGAYLDGQEYPGLQGGKRDRIQAVWHEICARMDGSGAVALAQ